MIASRPFLFRRILPWLLVILISFAWVADRYDLPSRCRLVFWRRKGPFDLESWVNQNIDNKYVQTGLLGKIRMAKALHLFGQFDIKGHITQMEQSGGALMVNLRGTRRKEREVIVEFVVRRLANLRTKKEIRPLCIFAEEAQLT